MNTTTSATGASRPLLDVILAIKAALQRDNVTVEQARRLLAYWDVLQAREGGK